MFYVSSKSILGSIYIHASIVVCIIIPSYAISTISQKMDQRLVQSSSVKIMHLPPDQYKELRTRIVSHTTLGKIAKPNKPTDDEIKQPDTKVTLKTAFSKIVQPFTKPTMQNATIMSAKNTTSFTSTPKKLTISSATPSPVRRPNIIKNKTITKKEVETSPESTSIPTIDKNMAPEQTINEDSLSPSIASTDNATNNNAENIVTPNTKTAKELEFIFDSTVQSVDNSLLKTVSFGDLIAVQVMRCWKECKTENPHAKGITATLNVLLAKDGSVKELRVYRPTFKREEERVMHEEMVKNAITAVRECSPIKGLSPEQHSEWEIVKFNFKY